ncbi:4-hydroxy-tetrahydrodipicolinate reductase [Apilactobacillus apisilvae]|uniref:4-hydroxy-tetrahydrodipicolinate reductase n=1 Tax=Apilactobacillus apisilvae TaxID=2923364 RepID=A0ABY4PGG7_9LACO|nr:4-hydroxy-tetrahydrodipicolinate reductase [Apilactobacillus apisilvae]UQS84432.1 4-hydroxy-tetrahydrodipicolinate reductase [Apilactobacillus apisilvae]
MIKVLLAGFTGSMGQKAINLIDTTKGMELSGVYSPHCVQDNAKYDLASQVKIYNSLDQIDSNYDVWVDFTQPDAVYENTKFAIEHDIHPVIGTSGMKDEHQKELLKLAQTKQLGGIIAPNFGLSAVLLMKFAGEAAKYFPDAEVIEMHHQDKKDAPSGTALNTAKIISANRDEDKASKDENKDNLSGSRGGTYDGVHVHAVRLPGYVAHEQVLFGGAGEALTLRQDSFDRGSFMKGVKVAIEKVADLDHLVIGLENIL